MWKAFAVNTYNTCMHTYIHTCSVLREINTEGILQVLTYFVSNNAYISKCSHAFICLIALRYDRCAQLLTYDTIIMLPPINLISKHIRGSSSQQAHKTSLFITCKCLLGKTPTAFPATYSRSGGRRHGFSNRIGFFNASRQ